MVGEQVGNALVENGAIVTTGFVAEGSSMVGATEQFVRFPRVTVRSSPVLPPRGPVCSYCPERGASSPEGRASDGLDHGPGATGAHGDPCRDWKGPRCEALLSRDSGCPFSSRY